MDYILFVIKYTLIVILLVIEGMMITRVICQLFDRMASWKLTQFVIRYTEPVCMPYRLLFHRMNWFQQSPFDFAFFFTWITVSLLETIVVNLL